MTQASHILIVDDEQELVNFIRSIFEERGYRVTAASNGEEALKKMQDTGNPDLAIIDMSMPRMGGVEFFTRVLGPSGKAPFPVIILTALESLGDFFKEAQADIFMTKPFNVRDLLGNVDKLLVQRGSRNPVA